MGVIGTGPAEMAQRQPRRLPPELRGLFDDGGHDRVLSVDLPPGEVVWPDPTYVRWPANRRAAFWLTDDPVPAALWTALRREHPASGLWPVLMEDSVQPWSVGQVAPDAATEIDHFHVGAFMEEVWSDWIDRATEDQLELLDPFGPHCPGPADPAQVRCDPDDLADRYAAVLADQGMPLALTAVTRPADAIAVMGWQGAVHHNEWNVPLAAVVRSWEDRYATRLVAMGFNTLELSVAAPPATPQHALHIAAEHWTFCPDAIIQGAGTLLDYAHELIDKPTWSFWWD
ncbi:DUF4253 domain-containing protein [Sphaerisporangium rubeum]